MTAVPGPDTRVAPCPLCRDGRAVERVGRHERWEILRCAACDLEFADPMEEAGSSFYEHHPFYARPEACYTSPLTLNWDQHAFLVDHPRPGGRLLDIGCGTGYFAAAAARAGYRVAGLDPSRSQLEIARQRFGLRDLYNEPLSEFARRSPPASFDVVTAFQVLEHVAEPGEFIAAAFRLIAPGGHFAVGVPNWRVWTVFRAPEDVPPNHLTRWSRRSLTLALRSVGFDVLALREHRSAYGVLLRTLRLGLLRRAMARATAAGREPALPRPGVLALSIAKTRLLLVADLPFRALFTLLGVPGDLLYALARKSG